jgi:predicted SnoaL-like aldol condensation-catalyzing enzyme
MVKRKSRIVVSLVFICILAFLQFVMADQTKEKAAVSAAKAWLTLVDEGKYSESWDETSQYFKNAVPREHWNDSLKSVRSPLGEVISRNLKSKKYSKTLPGAPDGEYVVIQYETSFKNKQHAIETVTPMLDKDGKWRVSGYYIK